ncbi:MAG: hypothetical protein IT257_11340 [Chitinophagaceae bacterium]|nr:hypothetical protein [Chitinophagaceae bacterium]
MKNILLILLLIGSVLAAKAQQKTFQTAIDYNDFVVDLQDSIGYSLVSFNNVIGAENITHSDIRTLGMDNLEKCKKLTKAKIDILQKNKPFAKGDALKQAALNLFNFYYKTMNTDYKRMVELLSVETYTQGTISQLTEIQEKVTAEEKILDDAYIGAQMAFAKLYGFELTENKTEKDAESQE